MVRIVVHNNHLTREEEPDPDFSLNIPFRPSLYVMNEAALLFTGGVNSTLASLRAGVGVVVGVAAALLPDSQRVTTSLTFSQVKDAVLPSLANFWWWLDFTPQQSHALKSLLGILFINLILIFVSWHVYAHRISHTLSFNNLRIVEDILKKNTNFKLPKDNSTKI